MVSGAINIILPITQRSKWDIYCGVPSPVSPRGPTAPGREIVRTDLGLALLGPLGIFFSPRLSSIFLLLRLSLPNWPLAWKPGDRVTANTDISLRLRAPQASYNVGEVPRRSSKRVQRRSARLEEQQSQTWKLRRPHSRYLFASAERPSSSGFLGARLLLADPSAGRRGNDHFERLLFAGKATCYRHFTVVLRAPLSARPIPETPRTRKIPARTVSRRAS